MNRRAFFPLALLAAATLLTSCSSNNANSGTTSTGTTTPPVAQHLYASCNVCTGTPITPSQGNPQIYSSQIVSFSLNSSSATPVTTITGPAGIDWVGVQTDSAGNLYVVASPGGTPEIEVFAAGATGAATPIRTITSSSISPDSGFSNFQWLVVAPNGTVYYSDLANGLLVFPPTANGPTTPTVIMPRIDLYGGVVDSEGNLFYIDNNTSQGATINVLPANFTAATVPSVITLGGVSAGSGGGFVENVALDNAGNIYLYIFDLNGSFANVGIAEVAHTTTTSTVTPIKMLTIPVATGAAIPRSEAFTFDSSNNLYIQTSGSPLVIAEYSASATTGTPTPINTIGTTYSYGLSSFDNATTLAIH